MRAATASAAVVLAGVLALPVAASGADPVSYACSPAPADCTGWYRQPVRITWSVPPDYDTVGCDNQTFATDTTGTISTCKAGRPGAAVVTYEVPLRVDRTPPEITGAQPSRAPDHGPWYTAPLDVAFGGTDATSGLAGCTTATYGGAQSTAAVVTGTCTDVAGNVSAPLAYSFAYDATPPAIALSQTGGDHRVAVTWKVSDDTERVALTRRRARSRRARATTLMRGSGRRYADKAVRNGRRYVYRLTAVDAAGNVASAEVRARPGRRLLSPAAGARLSRAPLLTWTAARGSGYYNVQVFRGTTKVLSEWPREPRYQLRDLPKGRYTWYVWPGRGDRADMVYGRLIGRRTFSIR